MHAYPQGAPDELAHEIHEQDGGAEQVWGCRVQPQRELQEPGLERQGRLGALGLGDEHFEVGLRRVENEHRDEGRRDGCGRQDVLGVGPGRGPEPDHRHRGRQQHHEDEGDHVLRERELGEVVVRDVQGEVGHVPRDRVRAPGVQLVHGDPLPLQAEGLGLVADRVDV